MPGRETAGPQEAPRPAARLAGALLLLWLLPACAGRAPGDPAPGVGSTALDWAGLRIEYTMAPSPADRIRIGATVANRSPGRLVRELPFCVIRMRLYRGDRLAWDQGGVDNCFGVRTLHLEPGEERNFWASTTADRVLGDSLAGGDYLVRLFLPGSDRPGTVRTNMEVTLGEKTLRRVPERRSGSETHIPSLAALTTPSARSAGAPTSSLFSWGPQWRIFGDCSFDHRGAGARRPFDYRTSGGRESERPARPELRTASRHRPPRGRNRSP